MKNILLTIAYDGSRFHGWQRQPGERTVQGELEQVLSHTFKKDIKIDGTSRTDTGVHAYGQRASFKSDLGVPVEKLAMILNNSLSQGRIFNERIPGDIQIKKAEEVPEKFHARFDALSKTYIYKIRYGGEQDLFKRNYYYQLQSSLNLKLMEEAAKSIIGTHDFKSFEASGSNPRETTVRTVHDLKVIPIGPLDDSEAKEIHLHVTGDGFLYNMVRIIAGTLIEVGLEKRSPQDVARGIAACSRDQVGHTAPPTGLYLNEIFYDEDEMKRVVEK